MTAKYQKFKVHKSQWLAWSDQQKDAHWDKFLKAMRRKETDPIAISQSGQMHFPNEGTKRKLNQGGRSGRGIRVRRRGGLRTGRRTRGIRGHHEYQEDEGHEGTKGFLFISIPIFCQ